jgi:hypothetical protein
VLSTAMPRYMARSIISSGACVLSVPGSATLPPALARSLLDGTARASLGALCRPPVPARRHATATPPRRAWLYLAQRQRDSSGRRSGLPGPGTPRRHRPRYPHARRPPDVHRAPAQLDLHRRRRQA